MKSQEMDYKQLRKSMVSTQLVRRGIKDQRVLDAMQRIPRHLFVDESLQHNAYDDMALPISGNQTISQPYMVAIMTELLELRGVEKVLEIGTGSGYQAAVLSQLAQEVYTIERISLLAEKAKLLFETLQYTNIHVKIGDGSLGWPDVSPFDRIIITAASPQLPSPLIEQLSPDGIIVIPVGSRYSQQLLKARKTKEGLAKEYHTPCMFVPLIGQHGWDEGA